MKQQLLSLIPLTAAIVNFALLLFVLTRERRSRLSRVFLLWGVSMTLWNVGTFLMFRVREPVTAEWVARLQHFGFIFLPLSLLHLSVRVAQIRVPRVFPGLYAWFGLLAVSNFSGLFITGARESGWAFYAVPGPGYWLFTASYAFFTTVTIFLLFRRQQFLHSTHRARVRLLLSANAVLLVSGANDLLPIVGVAVYPLTDTPIVPLGSAGAIFYGVVVGYSVLQHHLLDIHVTLGKAAARIVRLLFLILIGLLQLLLLNALAPDLFTAPGLLSAVAVLAFSGAFAAIFFPRLFGDGEGTLERRWLGGRFGDRFEYHDRIGQFMQDMPFYAGTDALLDDLEKLLINGVGVRGYQIILLDETTHSFSLFRGFPDEGSHLLPNLRPDSAVIRVFRESDRPYLGFNLAYSEPGETELEHEARESLALFDPEFCFPLRTDDQPFGLMLIGEKPGGQAYTPNDLKLFVRLVHNLSLIINQMRLKQHVLLAEELELLGRMSRGMAHDLNNLLTPVSTFLQLSDSPEDSAGRAELLPVCLRNVRTIQDYVKEALFFSENRSLQLNDVRLDELITEVVALSDTKLGRRGVRVEIRRNPPLTVQLDKVLIQRLLGNVLSNAIDASERGGVVSIDIQSIESGHCADAWARLRIVDNGSGISRQDLRKIASGYFTTKATGDEQRGFGLGLAICRKIVLLHGGNLDIASQTGQGTIARIDLPVRQRAKGPETSRREVVTS
jgi:signal transduction histidine kinase